MLARQLVVENVLDGEWITTLSSNADGRVFAASRYGAVFQSTDNGLNWSEIFRLEDGWGYPWIQDLDPIGDDSLIVAHDLALIKLSLSDLHADTLSMPSRDILVANDGSLIGFNSDGIIRCKRSGLNCEVVGSVEIGDGYRRFTTSDVNPETHYFMQTYGQEFSEGYLARSTDDGLTWEVLRSVFSFYDVLELASGRLLIASQWGMGYSDDSVESIINADEGTGPWIDILSSSDGMLFTVYEGFPGYISSSNDDGEWWTWDESVVNAHVNRSIVFNDYIFFGTRQGVFRTTNPISTNVQSVNESDTRSGVLTLYPNPASSLLYLHPPHNNAGNADIRIVDLLGRQRFQLRKPCCADVPISVDISPLSPGLYIVTVATSNKDYSTTVVVTD